MKVLHITTIDEGGAYKATVRLSEALTKNGITSNILLRNKKNEDNEGTSFLQGTVQNLLSKFKNVVNLMLAQNGISRDLLGSNVEKHPLVREADVIVLHWINSFLSYKSLEQIINLNKPIVWVLHDEFPFTGGCHYSGDCQKFVEKCCACPMLNSNKEKDISTCNYLDKARIYSKKKIYFLGPSNWIVSEAKKSSLLSDCSVKYIPNCLNVAIFEPKNKNELRKKYGIPCGKKVVLFGADNASLKYSIKGLSYLLDALKGLTTKDYYLIIFGNLSEQDIQGRVKQEHRLVGYVNEEEKLAELYSVADVMVVPSLQEAFGYTVCEAMACGTPVVAFSVGGILDQIEHKKNGYLAECRNVKSLAEGIEYCAQNTEELGKNAHRSAQRFSQEFVGEKYKEYFEKILQNR